MVDCCYALCVALLSLIRRSIQAAAALRFLISAVGHAYYVRTVTGQTQRDRATNTITKDLICHGHCLSFERRAA